VITADIETQEIETGLSVDDTSLVLVERQTPGVESCRVVYDGDALMGGVS